MRGTHRESASQQAVDFSLSPRERVPEGRVRVRTRAIPCFFVIPRRPERPNPTAEAGCRSEHRRSRWPEGRATGCGESIHLLHPQVRGASVRFRSPQRRAGHFLFRQKVAKDHCAEHDGLNNILLFRLPCASRAKRAGANSHIHVFKHARLAPAWRCDARRHATARWSLRSRPSMACAVASQCSKSAAPVRVACWLQKN